MITLEIQREAEHFEVLKRNLLKSSLNISKRSIENNVIHSIRQTLFAYISLKHMLENDKISIKCFSRKRIASRAYMKVILTF